MRWARAGIVVVSAGSHTIVASTSTENAAAGNSVKIGSLNRIARTKLLLKLLRP
jgi:hypothetical protein